MLTEQQLESKVSAAAKKFAEDPIAVTTGVETNPEVGSHLLFTTVPVGHMRDLSILRVATPHLSSFVKNAIATIDAAKQISFYSQASGHPFFRGAFGYVFEKYFYVWFSSIPLANHDDNSELLSTLAPSQPRSNALKRLPLQPVGWEKVIVHGGVSGERGYKTANKHEVPFGWIPSPRSDASFDAVMCTKTHIVTIQVTVAASHTINPNGFEALATYLPKKFQKERKWAHVFVTNHPDTASKLGRKKYTVPRKVSIYTAVLNISTFSFSSEILNRAKKPSVSRHKLCTAYFVTYPSHQDVEMDDSEEMEIDSDAEGGVGIEH